MAEASEVKKQWEKVKDLDRTQETVSYFCHCTSEERKESIEEEDMLDGHSASKPSWLPLAQNDDLEGVFFTVFLYHGPGSSLDGLPNQSPYGEHRIKIPVEEIIDDVKKCNLYFESFYKIGDVNYVRIVLVKNHQKTAKKWCEKNLQPLDHDNNILKLTKHGELKCIVSYEDSKKLYTEVFVVGDIEDLKDKDAEWDTVTETGRGSY